MNKKEPSRFGAPFIEIIVAIGVFAFCSAIIAGVFLTADSLRRKSSDLLTANFKAQTEAELLLNDPAKYIDDNVPAFTGDGSPVVSKYFGADWEPADGNAEFVMTVSISEQKTEKGVMISGCIEIIKNSKYPFLKDSGGILVSFDVKRYCDE